MKNYYFLIFSLIATISFSQNNCLDFDGTSDYISMSTPLLPTTSADDTWTVEMMIKTTTTGDDTLFSQYITTDNNRSHININGTVSYWKFTSATVVASTTPVNDGLWHHIAIVKEGSGTDEVHLYVDGVMEDSGTDDYVMANVVTEISRINNGSDARNFPGQLDEMRIWNTARTQAEIQNNIDNELLGTETGLTSYYNFNQGVSGEDNTGITTLNDVTTNANNGTLNTFALTGTNSNWVASTLQNYNCYLSTNITVSTTASTINFNMSSSTPNNETDCIDGVTDDFYDLWYDFTMPFDGNVSVVGAYYEENRFQLFEGCSTTSLECFQRKGILNGLISGVNYKLRVYRNAANVSSGNRNFTIKAFETQPNDECVNSETIVISDAESTVNFGIGSGTVSYEMKCEGTGFSNYYDVWFDFEMPIDGHIEIDGHSNTNRFAVYEYENDCSGAQLKCMINSGLVYNLSANTRYKLRAYRSWANLEYTAPAHPYNFTIKTVIPPTPPANDDCENSTNIVVSTTATENFFFTTTIQSASVNTEVGCEGTTAEEYVDVWYDFTMPVNGKINIYSGNNVNNFAIYDGCGGAQFGCINEKGLSENLIAGTDYKLRVYRTPENAYVSGTIFNINADASPSNDDCASSEHITVSSSLGLAYYNLELANLNNEEGCVGSATDDYHDLWYDFDMPYDGELIMTELRWFDRVSIYDGCSGTEIACFSDDVTIENLIGGTNYKIRVYGTAAELVGSGNSYFYIRVNEYLANDDCSNPENITVSETQQEISFILAGVESNYEFGCGTTEDTYADVWYDFTMPIDGNINISNSTNNTQFALYNDTCGTTQIDCFSTSNGTFENLIGGTTYKLRVFKLQSQNSSATTSFRITSESTLGVDDYDLSKVISIYPNPVKEFININTSIEIQSIQLYTMQGEIVYESNSQNQILINNFTTGLYFIKIKSDKGVLTKKIIIQ